MSYLQTSAASCTNIPQHHVMQAEVMYDHGLRLLEIVACNCHCVDICSRCRCRQMHVSYHTYYIIKLESSCSPSLCLTLVADLEQHCRPDCILSTNTSTIDISVVGAKTKAASRILGAHFFSPAHIMPLLEIVRTPQTSAQVRGERVG